MSLDFLAGVFAKVIGILWLGHFALLTSTATYEGCSQFWKSLTKDEFCEGVPFRTKVAVSVYEGCSHFIRVFDDGFNGRG